MFTRFHGDTGCYTMLMFEPNSPLMHNYSGMGLGGATGSGVGGSGGRGS